MTKPRASAMPKTKYPLVIVEWVDAGSHDAWTPISEIGNGNQTDCITVGFFIKETAHAVFVAGTIDEVDEVVCTTMEIPHLQIKKITAIRKVEK